jgi:hypothetical protein
MTIKEGMEDDMPIPIITDVVVIPLEDKTTSIVTAPTNFTVPSGSAVASNPNSTLATTTAKHNTTTTNITKIITTASGSRIQLHNNLGRNSTGLQCQHCGKETVTSVRDMVGVTTIVAVIVLAVLVWRLCWVPFCVPSCKKTGHYCGHVGCRKKVGVTQSCA